MPSVFRRYAPAVLLLLGVLAHLLFLASLRTGWLAPLFEDTTHRFGPGCDFFSVYAAGVKAREGASVYTIGGHIETIPYAYEHMDGTESVNIFTKRTARREPPENAPESVL